VKCVTSVHPRLHLGLAVRQGPVGVVLVLLADELVRLLGSRRRRRLHGGVARLWVLLLELVAGQVLHNAGAKGVSQDVGDGAQPVTRGERRDGKERRGGRRRRGETEEKEKGRGDDSGEEGSRGRELVIF